MAKKSRIPELKMGRHPTFESIEDGDLLAGGMGEGFY
jgi:hypothetical protein